MASVLKRYKYDLSINGQKSTGVIQTRGEKAAMAGVLYMVVRRLRSWKLPLGRINISLELEELAGSFHEIAD